MDEDPNFFLGSGSGISEEKKSDQSPDPSLIRNKKGYL